MERLTDLHPGADYMCLALQMIYLGTLCKIPVSNGQIAPTCKIGTRTHVLPLVVNSGVIILIDHGPIPF